MIVQSSFWSSIGWTTLFLAEAGSQIFIKRLAATTSILPFGFEWMKKASASLDLWASLGCDVLSFLMWIVILQRTNLSIAVPQSTITFITVIAASWLIFAETPSPLEWLGCALIVAGISTLGAAPRATDPYPQP